MNVLKNVGYVKIVEILLNYGADINAIDTINNFTPLHRAAEKGEFFLILGM